MQGRRKSARNTKHGAESRPWPSSRLCPHTLAHTLTPASKPVPGSLDLFVCCLPATVASGPARLSSLQSPETQTLHADRAKQQPLTPDSCYTHTRTHTRSEQGRVQLAQGWRGATRARRLQTLWTHRYQLRNLQTQFRVEGKTAGVGGAGVWWWWCGGGVSIPHRAGEICPGGSQAKWSEE